MFTDDQATPVRVEVLVDLLRDIERGLPREAIYNLLQPKALGSNDAEAAKATVLAGLELALLKESGKVITLSAECKNAPDARAAIIAALDKRVLSSTETEKYFALYYSHYLGLGKAANDSREKDVCADNFMQAVFSSEARGDNRLNGTKLTGLHRWFSYAGLGWYDPAEVFQANPYDRLRRSLPAIFSRKSSLNADAFMAGIGKECPELDGGDFFRRANKSFDPKAKVCTLGLSHALIELHLDKDIRLDCPPDNTGWSIMAAGPTQKEGFATHRFAAVEFIGGR